MSFLKITDPAKRDFLVNEFLKSKRNIQQNFLSEKLSEIGLQKELTKLYKPITESQSAMAKELSSTSTALQALPVSISSQLKAITFPSYPSITDEGERLIKFGPIATKYIGSMASKAATDKTFGLYGQKGKRYIGDSEATISGDDVVVGTDTYQGTAGLWELITAKNPDEEIYTSTDLENYTDILLKTNAIVNPSTGKVRSSSSEKYKRIIKPIYEKYFKQHETQTSKSMIPSLLPQSGSGISLMPSDPNSLVEMLHLRLASFKAGNTGVRNEIIDISDELLRQNIIDTESYKKIMLAI